MWLIQVHMTSTCYNKFDKIVIQIYFIFKSFKIIKKSFSHFRCSMKDVECIMFHQRCDLFDRAAPHNT